MNNATTSANTGDVLKGVLYLAISFFIVLVNIMTVVSYGLRSRYRRGIPDIFILNLSISSILMAIIVVGTAAHQRITYNTHLGSSLHLCYIQYFFATALHLADVTITTSIAFDRFLTVYIPTTYRQKRKLAYGTALCFVVWITSACVAAIPLVFGSKLNREIENLCSADWTTDVATVVITNSYIQFIFVFVCYVGIYRIIKAHGTRHKEIFNPQYNLSSASACCSQHEKHKQTDERYINNSAEVTPMSEVGFPVQETFFTQPLSHLHTKPNIIISSQCTSLSEEVAVSLERKKSKRFSLVALKLLENVSLNDCSKEDDMRIAAPYDNISFESEFLDGLVRHSTIALKELTRNTSDSIISDHLVKLSKSNFSKQSLGSIATCENIDILQEPELFDQSHASYPGNSSYQKHIVRGSEVFPYCAAHDVALDTGDKKQDEGELNTNEKLSYPLYTEVMKRTNTRTEEKWDKQKIQHCNSLKYFWKESKGLAKTMGVVVIVFYISWMPLTITITVIFVSQDQRKYHDFLWYSYNLTLLSAAGIPIAYAVMCRPYREAYKALWKCICKNKIRKEKNELEGESSADGQN